MRSGKRIKQKELRRKILSAGSSFFYLLFHKRSNGQKAQGVFRLVEQNPALRRNNLVLLCRIKKEKGTFYRAIPLEGVRALKIKGCRFSVLKKEVRK